jgi:hypothetical protein
MRIDQVKKLVFIGLFATLTASGCASFPGKELPVYTNEQISVPEKKMRATFDVKFVAPGSENKKIVPLLEQEIERILTGSRVFEAAEPNKTDGEYHYSMMFRDEGNQTLAFLSGFISGLTFTVIPAYARDKYVLNVEVKQGDKVLKAYTYRDHMDSWIQVLLIVVTPMYWPPDVSKSVLNNMVMNFVHDFSSDLKSGIYVVQKQ